MINTDALTAAFKALRKAGFIARQSFLCCGGCACAGIHDLAQKSSPAKKARLKGGVYYHKQDAEAMYRGRPLYIGYGKLEGMPASLPTEEVGRAVAAALEAVGLEVSWDGNPMTRIVVRQGR